MTDLSAAAPQPVALECLRFRQGVLAPFQDLVSPEVRLTVRFPGRSDTDLWAYPVELERLALGHARTEWCPAHLRPTLLAMDQGLCILGVEPQPEPPPLTPLPALPPAAILDAMAAFMAAPGLWDGTGCFHRAAAFDPGSGQFLARAEDIGRHNCLDRLAGWGVEEGRQLGAYVLFVSARITASLMDKARRCGFRAMVSRSAVTTASVAAARTHGLTLLGFARVEEKRFTVFHDGQGWLAP